MPYSRVYVDQFLVNWGDRLFYEPYRSPKQRENSTAGWVACLLPTKAKSGKIKEQIARTTRKAPEVMVKITSRQGAGRGMKAIRSHLEYISRNSKLQLEDHEGQTIGNRAEMKELQNEWQQVGGSNGWPMAEECRNRQAFNVIFSMPQGTPPEKVKEAARDFFKEEFEDRSYVFALHTDTLKPHVHLCILAESLSRKTKRLNPRKKDLQQWREGFAEKLRKHGIDANATSRSTRGQTRFPVRQDRLHRSIRLKQPVPYQQTGSFEVLRASYRPQHEAWKQVSSVLVNSEDKHDRDTGEGIYQFWSQTQINQSPVTIAQQQEKGKEDGSGREKAFLYQPHTKADRREAPAKNVAHLRPLSSVGMVQHIKHVEKLLHHDARDHLERKGRGHTAM